MLYFWAFPRVFLLWLMQMHYSALHATNILACGCVTTWSRNDEVCKIDGNRLGDGSSFFTVFPVVFFVLNCGQKWISLKTFGYRPSITIVIFRWILTDFPIMKWNFVNLLSAISVLVLMTLPSFKILDFIDIFFLERKISVQLKFHYFKIFFGESFLLAR